MTWVVKGRMRDVELWTKIVGERWKGENNSKEFIGKINLGRMKMGAVY